VEGNRNPGSLEPIEDARELPGDRRLEGFLDPPSGGLLPCTRELPFAGLNSATFVEEARLDEPPLEIEQQNIEDDPSVASPMLVRFEIAASPGGLPLGLSSPSPVDEGCIGPAGADKLRGLHWTGSGSSNDNVAAHGPPAQKAPVLPPQSPQSGSSIPLFEELSTPTALAPPAANLLVYSRRRPQGANRPTAPADNAMEAVDNSAL
jgi:hypothetical protein